MISPEELLEAINQVLPLFRENKYTKFDIYRMCIEKGLLKKEQIASTTFYRFIREYDLLNDHIESNKKRLAFAMEHANDLWQADTMFGPYVKNNGKPTQVKRIAFIDDASRVICHAQFFFNENIDALVTALKAALYKRGIPKQLYVDNGSIYCSHEITLIFTTVKMLCHAFKIEHSGSSFTCEKRMIEEAYNLNSVGKALIVIIDDADLMEIQTLRKLRLLFEDFPKNYNIILSGQPQLLHNMALKVNEDIKSRVTYSTALKKMNPDDMEAFILRELDQAGLPHNTFTEDALSLVIRSCEGILRNYPYCHKTKKLYVMVRTRVLTFCHYDLLQKTICIWENTPKQSKSYDL